MAFLSNYTRKIVMERGVHLIMYMETHWLKLDMWTLMLLASFGFRVEMSLSGNPSEADRVINTALPTCLGRFITRHSPLSCIVASLDIFHFAHRGQYLLVFTHFFRAVFHYLSQKRTSECNGVYY